MTPDVCSLQACTRTAFGGYAKTTDHRASQKKAKAEIDAEAHAETVAEAFTKISATAASQGRSRHAGSASQYKQIGKIQGENRDGNSS
ncbi:hypothetical protein [Photobacterium ganghwense]|uniref:hypothetical protein n=1 Tax=Photobacterium ganghwense TaxID=320778 RepID=UPI001C2DB7F9|nr:hypothetical protein [Photobacterium ganghwense]MBV1840996.1 hypothetical protein [Photobacterium ganghwense]